MEQPETQTRRSRRTGPKRPVLFWGPPAAGKTTFLGCMLLRPPDGESGDQWRVVPADERSSDYAADVLSDIQAGRPPKPTMVTTVMDEPFWFKLQRHRPNRWVRRQPDEWDLVLLDPSGELFESNRLQTEAGRRLLDVFSDAGGLVLLIDPWAEDAARRYWSMFVDTIHEMALQLRDRKAGGLDAAGRLIIPTAICLTKMDRHPEQASVDAEAFLRDRIGSAYSMLRRSMKNVMVCSCSAYGSPDACATVDGEPRIMPRPWGLLEPLQWIVQDNSGGLFR